MEFSAIRENILSAKISCPTVSGKLMNGFQNCFWKILDGSFPTILKQNNIDLPLGVRIRTPRSTPYIRSTLMFYLRTVEPWSRFTSSYITNRLLLNSHGSKKCGLLLLVCAVQNKKLSEFDPRENLNKLELLLVKCRGGI